MTRTEPQVTPDDLWADIQPAAARRLLRAALESFATCGYHGTSTRHIATEAGMSPAAVYVHYRSKAQLLFEISRRGHESALGCVRDALDDLESPSARMRALACSFATWH